MNRFSNILRFARRIVRVRFFVPALLLLTLAAGCFFAWSRHVAPTRIALVNFRDFQYAEMLDANDSRWVVLDRIGLDALAATDLRRYDAIYFFGRGMNLSGPQQAAVRRAITAGTHVYVTGATNAASDVTSLDGDRLERVGAYFENGGRKNLAALFRYTRKVLDGKTLFSGEAAEPQVIPLDALFHLGDDRFFTTVNEYQAFYEKSAKFKPGRPKVCLLTSIYGPRNPNLGSMDELIRQLEAKGLNVYPVAGLQKRLDYLREIAPDLVVTIPHGRLAPGRAEEAIRYLDEQGVPLLCPIGVLENYDEWMNSQKGMQGGLMSQTIVMPELDGGSEPYAISALYPDARGLAAPKAIPDRVETFVSRVERWLALRTKPNAEKKLAIIYYKGPGQNAMVAAALEVAPSLLNLLRRLKAEGYETGPLPESLDDFQKRINREGPVLGAYALGAFDAFLKNGDPAMVAANDYLKWARQAIAPDAYAAVEKQYGPAPGRFLSVERQGQAFLALPRVQFGNIVLLPQLLPALGDDTSKLVHGAKVAPPHPYLATYLWARYGFQADALVHFGTHGSLEFTPWKQNSLSGNDWPDILVGDLPHFYLYIINNIGEAIIAKRRSYATLVSHLTPPFVESDLYGPLKELQQAVGTYQSTTDPALKGELVTTITRVVREQKLYKDLNFLEPSTAPLDDDQIAKVHDYLMTVGLEKITRGLYTLGVPYAEDRVVETVRMMAVDGAAQARAQLDQIKGKVKNAQVADKNFFNDHYYHPALTSLDQVLSGQASPRSFLESSDLARLARWDKSHPVLPGDKSAASEPRTGAATKKDGPRGTRGGRPKTAAVVAGADAPGAAVDEQEREYVEAVRAVRDALSSVNRHRAALISSTKRETDALIGALNGHYVTPSPGGDAITNPDAVPTGRNLTAIDAEKAPSVEAWQVGKALAEETIRAKVKETGQLPKKVAISLWGGEFINSQGVDIAIVLHLMGVEPVRNARGEVYDVRLVPSRELNRPRIDVVVQTSGQLRDIAASRMALIDRAVKLASSAQDNSGFENNVQLGTVAAESIMKERGLSPAEAKTFATARIFGGVNGSYGTRIMGLVEAGDHWESDKDVSGQYLKNMGAVYTADHWSHYVPGVFEGALQNTDTLLHSRTSNLTGPLSLDHVYEFMGGLNATIRNVTGRDPDAYFADMRNKHRPVMQAAKEAIWVEARSTLLNPKYIRDLQAGGASSADVFAETFRNTYGWNVMKPEAVDDELWNELYAVYIEDREKLGLRETFARKNPFALQEITAVMIETARKGLWKASPGQVRALAILHTDLIREYRPGCSGFVCDNAKLRESIENVVGPERGQRYASAIADVRQGQGGQQVRGTTLERETIATVPSRSRIDRPVTAILAGGGVLLVVLGLMALGYFWRRAAGP
jgi:cobaltochelatase CobN